MCKVLCLMKNTEAQQSTLGSCDSQGVELALAFGMQGANSCWVLYQLETLAVLRLAELLGKLTGSGTCRVK